METADIGHQAVEPYLAAMFIYTMDIYCIVEQSCMTVPDQRSDYRKVHCTRHIKLTIIALDWHYYFWYRGH